MKSTVWLWRGLGISSLACLLLLLAGFVWALKDHWMPADGIALPEASEPPAAAEGSLASKPELKITALGDSLTVGTGDATGIGYVKRAADGLSKAMDKPVRVLNNLAIGGLRADQLTEQLKNTGVKNAVLQADIIFLTIGANDLFQFATSGGSMVQGSEISPELLEERMEEGENRLKNVFAAIRELNKAARIVYIGLYNPFYDLRELREEASQAIQDWNAFVHELAVADGNASVVPTFDLFEHELGKYLSSDHFHPNEAGYIRIAERVVQALQ
jgi:lysophospholipase L1-like esterase